MSEYLYRGRHCSAEKRARPKSIGPMMDFSCDETDKGPPVQMHSLREFEQIYSPVAIQQRQKAVLLAGWLFGGYI
ncbi:hypothetical protein PBY51_024159 [Eleginops maclovinus]|uniref:Uncharacterized protein n=1 Tax=Eleginops maclovinus TaxID=56733 RepID=A0AAN8ARB8_ELEMC|nr:hypothetical protein PBY51_024159 [Eleginops maclovinus]